MFQQSLNLIKSLTKSFVVASTLGLTTHAMAATELTTTNTLLTADAAAELAYQAMMECRTQGYNVSASVVDRSGNLLAMSRHEMAGPHTIKSSQRKAFTAASMGRPTDKLAQLVTDKPVLAGLRDMDERLLLLGGGLPISVNNSRLGGIGVGGAPGGHLDVACAEKAMAKVLKN